MIHYLVAYSLKGDDPRKDIKPLHLEFLTELYNAGTLVCAGVLTDRPGGYLLFRTGSEEETRAIVEHDPYIIHGARSYTITGWDLSPFPLR
ncbi:uncharacterized protein YciI [Natronocella acetinitrilica]|uniref:Uncharacterized protein YciI n=1 Tax=Natronocella acetinitrilica TaxID=414046 RepID=A0AAE3G4W0_9GAMM|nr:YciI family protein [Natronocella acetinitrilica]MCP1675855.1 uncharacterized protein YciI [Natronocella acetinitrilica]